MITTNSQEFLLMFEGRDREVQLQILDKVLPLANVGENAGRLQQDLANAKEHEEELKELLSLYKEKNKATEEKLRSLKEDMQKLESELTSLRLSGGGSQQPSQPDPEAEAERQKLLTENEGLRKVASTLSEEKKALMADARRLGEEVYQLRQKQAVPQNWEIEKRQLVESYANLQKQYQLLAANASNQQGGMAAEVQRLQKECEDWKKKHDLQRMAKEEQTKKAKEMEARITKLSSMSIENERLKKAYDKLELEKKTLASKLSRLELEKSQQQQKEQQHQPAPVVDDKLRRRNEKSTPMSDAELQQRRKDKNMPGVGGAPQPRKSKNDVILEELSELEAENANLKNRQHELETTNMALQRQLDEMQNEDDRAKELEQLRAANKQMTDAQSELTDVNTKLSEEAQTLRTDKQQLSQEAETLRGEKQQLTQEAETLRGEKQQLAQEAETLRDEKQKLAEEAETLRDEKQKLAEEAETLRDEKQKFTKETESLRSEKQQLSEAKEALEAEKKALEEELTALRKAAAIIASVSTEKQDASEEKKETVSEKKEAEPEEKQEIVSEEKKETVSEEKQEAAPEEKKETAPEEKQEAASEEKKEAVPEEKQEAASEEKQETASEEKPEAVSEEKQEPAPEEKQEADPEEQKKAAEESLVYETWTGAEDPAKAAAASIIPPEEDFQGSLYDLRTATSPKALEKVKVKFLSANVGFDGSIRLIIGAPKKKAHFVLIGDKVYPNAHFFKNFGTGGEQGMNLQYLDTAYEIYGLDSSSRKYVLGAIEPAKVNNPEKPKDGYDVVQKGRIKLIPKS